jgi:hypothetical protein
MQREFQSGDAAFISESNNKKCIKNSLYKKGDDVTIRGIDN